MGHGSYTASDWVKLKTSRGINASSSADQIFQGNTFQEKYCPYFINVRESCDSADSPQATPIILGFDVTGSMGYLAAEIAKNALNETVTEIYHKQPVTNPHVLCAAITSPSHGQNGALQVTQFEADIRIVEQLLELRVGFGGNRFSYDSLVWYFAARHTKIDCIDKHGRKGFLFCIGDEICGRQFGETLTPDEIKTVFNDDVDSPLTLEELYREASKKYEIYHIVTGSRWRGKEGDSWRQFLPDRVATLPPEHIDCLAEVILSILQLHSGMPLNDVIAQWPDDQKQIIRDAVTPIAVSKPARRTFAPGSVTAAFLKEKQQEKAAPQSVPEKKKRRGWFKHSS